MTAGSVRLNSEVETGGPKVSPSGLCSASQFLHLSNSEVGFGGPEMLFSSQKFECQGQFCHLRDRDLILVC